MRTAELMEELRKLPMRPSAVTQVLAVLDDPSKSARDVAGALQCDPSLCVRVLHLANSPYFGVSGKVGSLDRAVVTLGNSVIRSLAVSTAAGLFAERAATLPEGFWRHSVTTAAASSVVAQHARVPAGDALCAGLLHDLGVALIYRHDPEGYDAVRTTTASTAEMLVIEAERYGADHAALGAIALEAWKLPQMIVDATAHHHDAPESVDSRLSCVVIAGEAITRSMEHEEAPFQEEPSATARAGLLALGLQALDLEKLAERVGEDSQALQGWLSAAAA